jgi:hypothetical protein
MGTFSNTPADSASALKSATILQLNNVVSSPCGLFVDSLCTLCKRDPLFSVTYGLFCQKHGGGGTDEVFDRAMSKRVGSLTRTPAVVLRTVTMLPPPHWRTMRSQCSRTHTESRRQRWWNISQKISATRAASFMRSSRCGIRAQPMAARFTQLVDALNRESRQILHRCLRNCA